MKIVLYTRSFDSPCPCVTYLQKDNNIFIGQCYSSSVMVRVATDTGEDVSNIVLRGLDLKDREYTGQCYTATKWCGKHAHVLRNITWVSLVAFLEANEIEVEYRNHPHHILRDVLSPNSFDMHVRENIMSDFNIKVNQLRDLLRSLMTFHVTQMERDITDERSQQNQKKNQKQKVDGKVDGTTTEADVRSYILNKDVGGKLLTVPWSSLEYIVNKLPKTYNTTLCTLVSIETAAKIIKNYDVDLMKLKKDLLIALLKLYDSSFEVRDEQKVELIDELMRFNAIFKSGR